MARCRRRNPPTRAELLKSYRKGYGDGRADKGIGFRSEYAWKCALDGDGWSHWYGVGYHDGWSGHERKFDLPESAREKRPNPSAQYLVTIKKRDVGRAKVYARGRLWDVTSCLGTILLRDIGKRLYTWPVEDPPNPATVVVENEGQRNERLRRVNPRRKKSKREWEEWKKKVTYSGPDAGWRPPCAKCKQRPSTGDPDDPYGMCDECIRGVTKRLKAHANWKDQHKNFRNNPRFLTRETMRATVDGALRRVHVAVLGKRITKYGVEVTVVGARSRAAVEEAFAKFGLESEWTVARFTDKASGGSVECYRIEVPYITNVQGYGGAYRDNPTNPHRSRFTIGLASSMSGNFLIRVRKVLERQGYSHDVAVDLLQKWLHGSLRTQPTAYHDVVAAVRSSRHAGRRVNPINGKVIARWLHGRGDAFVDLIRHEGGHYSVRADGYGGAIYASSDGKAIENVQNRVDKGVFTPDAYKTPLRRVL